MLSKYAYLTEQVRVGNNQIVHLKQLIDTFI